MRSAPGRRGDRDDHLVGLGLVEDLRQLARRAAHAHAVDPQPPLERVVVDEADRVQAELRVARELLADLAPALAGADDQHVALVVAGAQAGQPAVVDRAREHARRGQEDQREQEVEGDHAARAGRSRSDSRRGVASSHYDRVDDRDDADQQHGRDDQRAHEQLDVALADVAPAPLVDARGREDQRRCRATTHGHVTVSRRSYVQRHAAPSLEAQPEREVVRERDQCRVHRELGQRVAVQREGRRAQPSAHQADCRAPGGAKQERDEQRRGRGARARPRRGVALAQLDLLGPLEAPHAPVGDQLLVDRAEAALERGPDRRPERDRLAVHRAAGADHEVGVGDQRLGVDRVRRAR